MMVSYAQNFEDVLLHRAFGSVEKGFYVDIGAADPVRHSVTKAFYDRGWRGINVEPSSVFKELASARPGDVNLQVAVGEGTGWVCFYEVILYPECSGTSIIPVLKDCETVQYRVPQRRLSSILDHHAAGRDIHFLKIDVEGAEEEVIRSCDWNVYRPVMVLAEATVPVTDVPSHHGWEPLLLEAGYLAAWFDGVNRWYVRKENKELLSVFEKPISAFDQFVPHLGMRKAEPDNEWEEELSQLQDLCKRQENLLLERALVISNLSLLLQEKENGLFSMASRWLLQVSRRMSDLMASRASRSRGSGRKEGAARTHGFVGTLERELEKLPKFLRQASPKKEKIRPVVTNLRCLLSNARVQRQVSCFPYDREIEEMAEGLSRLGK